MCSKRGSLPTRGIGINTQIYTEQAGRKIQRVDRSAGRQVSRLDGRQVSWSIVGSQLFI